MEIFLNDIELQNFSKHFNACNVDKNERIPKSTAMDFFGCANLTDDVMSKILSLAAICENSTYILRPQFYACLKLISAHQASLSLSKEILYKPLEMPLPQFKCDNNGRTSELFSNVKAIMPQKSDDCIKQHVSESTEAWSTNSESPTPTNSIAGPAWPKEPWLGIFEEEHRQLLGTEEESSDRHSSDDEKELGLEKVYEITAEQREYYIKQFEVLLKNSNKLVPAQTAISFFEKSRIQKEEIGRLWELCDVKSDASLNLAEFTAIMHLIVLRRNSIPLPAVLPSFLHPNALKESLTIKQIYEETSKKDSVNLIENDKTEKDYTFCAANVSAVSKEPITSQWTKFSESPSSSVSSPVLKPLNFDMMKTSQAIVSDPQILHPVALRITPLEYSYSKLKTQNDESSSIQLQSFRDVMQDEDEHSTQTFHPPKVTHQYSGGLSQSQHWDNSNDSLSKNLKISSIPPKSYRRGRSNSLDLSKFNFAATNELYKISKNSSQNMDLLVMTKDFAATTLLLDPNDRISAFEIYRGKQILSTVKSPSKMQHTSSPGTNLTLSSTIRNHPTFASDMKHLNEKNEALRHISIEKDGKKKQQFVQYLRDQNKFILSLCKDLSAELLLVQNLKNEIRRKIESVIDEVSLSSTNVNITAK